MRITELRASMNYDSKARPTIRVDLEADRIKTFASAPSGTSVGKFEAQAFPVQGVEKAVALVNSEIRKRLVGFEVNGLSELDDQVRRIDGTSNFGRIGGNTALAISIASAKALAENEGRMLCEYLCGNGEIRLPFPLSNVIGGGRHTTGDSLDFQEFLVLALGAETFAQAAMFNAQVHKEVGTKIVETRPTYVLGRNDEGAWAAPLRIKEALDILAFAVEKVGKATGIEGKIGLDVAASELWDGKKYGYKKEGLRLETSKHLTYLRDLAQDHDIVYIEDPFEEEDFESFSILHKELGAKRLVVGDDLIVTNRVRLQTAIDNHAINGVIIKPNQIGTITDTKMTVELARKNLIVPVASHRSGETADAALAHIATGLGCPILKIGISGGERLEKINELMRIERITKAPMARLLQH